MKDFKARTDGINAMLADELFVETDGVAPVDSIKPGVLLLMDTSGQFGLLGATTVDLSNKHLVYYCNSWAASVSAYGNGMVSAIPITKQFEYEMTFDTDEDGEDFLDATFNAGPSALLCIRAGKLDVATSGDYVIGSVKAGTCTNALGGTLTIVTWGGDYVVS